MALTGLPPAVFMRDGNPDDPRAQRTRRILLETYENEMMSGRPVRNVAALVRASGVSRSSFYCHFAGIEEVGLAAMRELLDSFGSAGTDSFVEQSSIDVVEVSNGPTASLLDLFRHFADHRELYACLLRVTDGQEHPACTELRSVLGDHFVEAFEGLDMAPPLGAPTVAKFVVGGLMAVLVDWLDAPEQTPEELVGAIATLVPSWLKSSPVYDKPLRVTRTLS